MLSLRLPVAVASTLTLFSLFSSVYSLPFGFNYGSQKVRGVNLGGWLVLEPWITPSIFDNTGDNRIVDEYTFGQYQSKSKASATLKNHWDTWITESDFSAIAAAGLNHVRIPIGFWAFDVSGGEPYIQGQVPYLQKAVTWASRHNIKVIVDLHGCPGSQNGYDNSGQRKDYPQWQTKQSYINRCSGVIKQLANMYKDNANVVPVIEALNEPAGYYSEVLSTATQFWYDSYGNIRYPYGSSRQGNTVVLIHDAFQPLSHWNGFLTPDKGYQGVMMDTHIYQIFSDAEEARGWDEHISFACSLGTNLENYANNNLWTVVGEWTPATTDCAKYLNGRGRGSRYDGSYPGSTRQGSCNGHTGKSSTFSNNFKIYLRQMWEAQVMTFERAQGWIQWTWKAENADEWSYQAGLAGGWIPRDPTQRKYPNICG